MATKVIMPKLGNTVESCVILGWKVKPGDHVEKDTVLCEIETDKATMDVPAGLEGTILALLHNEGDDVPVLQDIAVIGEAGEKWAEVPSSGKVPANASATSQSGTPKMAEAAQPGVISGASSGPVPQSADVQPATPQVAPTEKFASPRARQAMTQLGVQLDAVAEGSGPNGRIIERDIIAASQKLEAGIGEARSGQAAVSSDAAGTRVQAASSAVAAPAASAPSGADMLGPYTDTPIKSIRKIIAERMLHSLQSSAQLTFNASAPAAKLLALRARLKNSDPAFGMSGVTVGDLVGFAATHVLARYPHINAHVVDNNIRSYRHIHLGVAVDTPRGLMVPVLKNADAMSLRQFSDESKRLAKGCLEGTINPDDLTGATFTATNLGAFGIESFTPILNTPEVGILGVDCIMPRPTAESVASGEPKFEMRIGFSLTVDHRIVDGADAARFLKDLSDYIANIDIAVLA